MSWNIENIRDNGLPLKESPVFKNMMALYEARHIDGLRNEIASRQLISVCMSCGGVALMSDIEIVEWVEYLNLIAESE